ncbi:AAA family ATPase [Nitrospirota bacterium]
MAFTIGFAGKGGTGKTSIAAIAVRYLLDKRKGPVLAVDADSNACLNEALGLEVHATIGSLREDSLAKVRDGGDRPGGMTTEQLFDYQVQQSVMEAEGFDLMVMGRPEGPGCYCAANNIIRKYTDLLSEDYPYVVIDNEAGMEHLSRRTTHAVDLLLIVSDPTIKGLQTIKRINSLVDELNLDVKDRAFVVNRVTEGQEDEIIKQAADLGLTISAFIPQDPKIAEFDLKGAPVLRLPEESIALKGIFGLLEGRDIP